MTNEYNKELLLAHDFIKQQYEVYLHSNKIKSNDERRAYAHAVHITQYIANHCNIEKKDDKEETSLMTINLKELLRDTALD